MGTEIVCTLKVWMRGEEDCRLLRVSEDDWVRARSIVGDGDKNFIALNTAAGSVVFLNCAHLLAAHFLWDPAAIPTLTHPEPVFDELRAHLVGRKDPITAGYVEPEELEALCLQLDGMSGDQERFIIFPDEDGEDIALHVEDLFLLEFPASWRVQASDDG